MDMAAGRILCVGAYPALQRTLWFDRFAPGTVNRSQRVGLDVAGKAVNAARALRRLGGLPVLAGFCGGATGVEVARLLADERLEAGMLRTVAAPVRVCQTILPADGSPFTELVEEGPVLSESDWQALTQDCRNWLQASGTAPLLLAGTMPQHASLAFYPDLIRAAGGPVLLDTSGAALLAALPTGPDLVKINQDELRASCGGTGQELVDLVRMARDLITGGAGAVGVTHGAGEAVLVTAGEVWTFAIPPVAVVSALGSGDSVNAGVLFALQNGQDLLEAFRFGLACGCANAETVRPGWFDIARVTQLQQAIDMRVIR